MRNNLKILIYGAGAIGSIFAGMIARSGYDVTILARGKRLDELQQNGLILVNSISNERLQLKVKTTDILNAHDIYDYTAIPVLFLPRFSFITF